MILKLINTAATAFIFLFAHSCLAADVMVANDASEIQPILDSGNDVALVKGKVYEIHSTILYKRDGQKIFTMDAARISEYATLRLASFDCTRLIHSNTKSDLLLEKVILDGNRYGIAPDPKSKLVDMTFFGGRNGYRHIIRNCVFMNPRSWTNLKVNEQGRECIVQNCIFFGGGSDIRGNGRHPEETPVLWGDGITFAAADSKVSDNIVMDSTDVGIVLFCAPGTVVEHNVVAAVSREMLGGINMVDFIPFYELDKKPADPNSKFEVRDMFAVRKYNYRGTRVSDNLVDALGSRIHIGIPIGKTVWVPNKNHLWLYIGGTVEDNTITGDALGYGIIVDGVTDFKIKGNKSFGKYSGYPDGLRGIKPDDPAAFLYDPENIGTSVLQDDFKPKQRAIMHMLRCNYGPRELAGPYSGYKLYEYGDFELDAVIQTAFMEMLERQPTSEELQFYRKHLNENRLPADDLRKTIFESEVFKKKFGEMQEEELHPFRTKKWMDAFDEVIGENDQWNAKTVYSQVLEKMKIQPSKLK